MVIYGHSERKCKQKEDNDRSCKCRAKGFGTRTAVCTRVKMPRNPAIYPAISFAVYRWSSFAIFSVLHLPIPPCFYSFYAPCALPYAFSIRLFLILVLEFVKILCCSITIVTISTFSDVTRDSSLLSDLFRLGILVPHISA
jgi:hypothetical protein